MLTPILRKTIALLAGLSVASATLAAALPRCGDEMADATTQVAHDECDQKSEQKHDRSTHDDCAMLARCASPGLVAPILSTTFAAQPCGQPDLIVAAAPYGVDTAPKPPPPRA